MTAEVEMAVSNSQLASVPSAVPMADAAVAVELLRMIEDELGCDPHTVVGHEAAAALRSVHAGDRIAAGLLVDVFDRTATSLEMPDLAVRFAEWATISRLGYVAQLWSHMPTLGELLDAATRYLPLENGALLANIDRDGTEVWFSYHLRQRFGGRETMFMETNIAVAVRTIRACFGEDWNPIRVTFRHHPRTSLARLSGYYGVPVAVGTSSDAICFTTADMSRRGVDAGDDTSGDIILQFLQERVNRPAPDLLSQVSRLLARHLDTGSDVSVAATAAALAMSPRTLQRRLREAGTDFGAILSDVRADLVEHYLTDLPDLPVADLAERLGYADATAVSRFVRARFGCDTRALRTRLARQGTDRRVGLVARFDK